MPPARIKLQLQMRRYSKQFFSSYAQEITGLMSCAPCFCLFSFSCLPFFSFLSSFLLRGLVLLNARVERVINERGVLCGLRVIVCYQRKSAADYLQAASCWVVVQLTFDVRRLHDAGHFQQYRIVSQPFT